MSQKPLEGIRVIDLTRVLAGPFCTMVLKNLGAEIIKIESPLTGDDSRQFGPFIDDDPNRSAYFISVNSGKKSIVIDLKNPEGKAVLNDLIKVSDVLMENFRPGTLERLGFSDSYIKNLNPKIIHTTASGFGYSGPESQKPAYDSIIQALSGIMSITGTEAGETVRVGTSISDIVTGLYSAIGIISALFRRDKTGEAARIDVAMLDSTVSVLENAIARYQVFDKNPVPLGSRHPSITPFETFTTKDSEIIIAAGNDKLFAAACKVIGKPELISDDRFISNILRTKHQQQLKEEIDTLTCLQTSAYWLEKLHKKKVPCAKVNNMQDLFEYKQLQERNMILPVDEQRGFKISGNPVKFMNEPESQNIAKTPDLGEHTAVILEDLLGYSKEKVQKLLNIKAVSQAD